MSLSADFWGLARQLPLFQSFQPLPIYNWHPSSYCMGCGSQSGRVCVHSRLSWEPGSFFGCPNPHWVYSQKLWGFIFSSTGTLGCTVWPRAGITHLHGGPLVFIHNMEMWDCLFCRPLLPCFPWLPTTTPILWKPTPHLHPCYLSGWI